MRVLLVVGSLPPMRCGVGDYTLKLARSLQASGVEVGVLTSTAALSASSDAEGVAIFPCMESWTLDERHRVERVIGTWKPDIVHLQVPSRGYRSYTLPSFLPLLLAIHGIKVVRTWHEVPRGRGVAAFLLQAFPPGPFIYVRPEFLAEAPAPVRRWLSLSKHHFIPGASAIARSELSESKRLAVRKRYVGAKARLIVYFGFLYPFKGVHLLFDILDPATDQLIIVGEPGEDMSYVAALNSRAAEVDWRNSVELLGFLPDAEAANLIAAADAVVLPFAKGGGTWNSSIHAAVLQGTPVVTTSRDERGLDAQRMVYSAEIGDVDSMREGLKTVAGRRRIHDASIDRDDWQRIARDHRAIYQKLGRKPERRARR